MLFGLAFASCMRARTRTHAHTREHADIINSRLWGQPSALPPPPLQAGSRGEHDYRIFSASVDNTVRLWDPYDMACIRVLEEQASEVSALTYYEGWDIVVTGGGGGGGSGCVGMNGLLVGLVWRLGTGRGVKQDSS